MIKVRLAEKLSEVSSFSGQEIEEISDLIANWTSQSVNGNGQTFEVGEHTLAARLQDDQLCIRCHVVLGHRNGETTGNGHGFQFRMPIHE